MDLYSKAIPRHFTPVPLKSSHFRLCLTFLLVASPASAACVNYTVIMSDSYGDGWNSNILHVGNLTFTLSSGSYGAAKACIDPGKTYTPYACGGNNQSEVTWSVGGVSGGANINCAGSASFAATEVPSPAPTTSELPTLAPTATFNPTMVPTLAPTKSAKPTIVPTLEPTQAPTASLDPTTGPTLAPTTSFKPTTVPTPAPTTSLNPTGVPTSAPTTSFKPTTVPTLAPTISLNPTIVPTQAPTISFNPTIVPSPAPSSGPTISSNPTPVPTLAPTTTYNPSIGPTLAPTASFKPTIKPTLAPTTSFIPTTVPTSAPTQAPTMSFKPTAAPSLAPTISVNPTVVPTPAPTMSFNPTTVPTLAPTISFNPTIAPTPVPSSAPTISFEPTIAPTPVPSSIPTISLNPTPVPTLTPTITVNPTPVPTYAPTSVTGVTTPSESNAAASKSNSVVFFASNIAVSDSALSISGVEAIVLKGTGKTVTLLEENPDSTSDMASSCSQYSFAVSLSSVTMNDFVMYGGGFAGMCISDSTVTLNQISFYNCSIGMYPEKAGALFVTSASAVILSDVFFQENVGSASCMQVDGASAVLKRVNYTSNTNALGVVNTNGASGSVLLTSVKFTLNSGALNIAESTVAMRYVQFEENSKAMVVDISNSGVVASPSSVTLDMVSFTRNSGKPAMGIYGSSLTSITMNHVTFASNHVDDNSGSAALYKESSDSAITASNLVFYDNTLEDTSSSESNFECKADACTEGTKVVTATGGDCTSCGPCDSLGKGLVTMCSLCGAGLYSYRNATSSASCLDCAQGNRSFSGMNSSCPFDQCPAGSYGPLDSAACIICQNGYATYTAGLSVCTKCQFFEWCPTDGLCIEGHTGVGCAECEPKWYMKDNTCTQCPESAKIGLALAVILGAFLLNVLYKLAGSEKEEEDDNNNDIKSSISQVPSATVAATAVAKFNVALSFFQITTLVFFSFSFKFPFTILNWLNWIALPLSFDFVDLGRPECSAGTSMGVVSRWAINTFVPLCIMLPFALLAWYRKESQSQAIATIALIGTSTYVPVVTSAMTVWRCENNDYGQSVLASAPSVSCDGSGDFYSMLAASILVTATYLCGIHVAVPKLSKKDGFEKVKRTYVQDFDKGRKWWYHITLGYKLSTVFVVSNVADTLAQLMLMFLLSSSMSVMCFIYRPHTVLDGGNSKKKYWNDKCTLGCRSIWNQWSLHTKVKWFFIQGIICVVLPVGLCILSFVLREIKILVALGFLAFLFLFGPLFCAMKCYYEYIFERGFTPNNVEIILHTIEAILVFITIIYEAVSRKHEHSSKQIDDDFIDDDTYDHHNTLH